MHQARAQLQRKGSHRKARENIQKMEKEPCELLLDCPPSSSMEMETIMKRPEVTLEDVKDVEVQSSRHVGNKIC